MKRAAFALLLFSVSVACERRGPLPEVYNPHSDSGDRADWFPSASNDAFPLDLAIRADRIDEVRRLLDSGANPNTRWSQSGDRFALREALDTEGRSASNQVEIVRVLLQHGADPNAKWCPAGTRDASSEWFAMARCQSSKGMTPLISATILSQREIVEMLLQAGADPRAESWSLQSALDDATDDIVFELIARKQFPELGTRDHNALAWLDRHFTSPSTPAERTTPLSRALSRMTREDGDTIHSRGRLRIVLSLGANPNEPDRDGRTPLSMAMLVSLSATRLLLEHGADVNRRWCPVSWDGEKDPSCSTYGEITPLMWAARAGDAELVRMLLEFGANLDATDSQRRIAWHYASTREVWELLKVR